MNVTATWDVVQEYLTSLATLQDPELFETGITFIKRLISTIHDADHAQGERLSRAIWEESSVKAIRTMIRRARRMRRPPGGE